MKTWTVRAGDGDTVGAIVRRAAPGDARAIEDGRVFVGKERARSGAVRVAPGDEVTIAPSEAASAPSVRVIAREKDFVAVDKPAGIPTIPDHGGASRSLLALTAAAIGLDVSKLHPTSRLDRDVSGVVVFALAKSAADRFVSAREKGTYVRRYVAIASHSPASDRGEWTAPIGRARDPRLRAANGKDSVVARSLFGVVARAGDAALLALAPITGRTHQLRVHASHAGAPLFGDRSYGGPTRLTLPTGRVLSLARIALHAARVVVPAPNGEPVTLSSPIPGDLADLWLALGGSGEAWDIAVSCTLDDASVR